MNTMHESMTLADAGAMIEACRSELEKRGFQEQADELRGLEILCSTDAELALYMLQSMKAPSGVASDTCKYAINSLRQVLGVARLAS